MRIELTSDLAKAEKKSALRLLKKLKAELPPDGICYVAGGAPRDWHHGWGCRDLDIFYMSTSDPYFVPKVFGKLKRSDNYDEYYSMGGYLTAVHNFDGKGTFKDTSIQLVNLCKDPLSVIQDDFPISLSRIWMDVDGNINSSEAYDWSYDRRMILECHNDTWNYTYLGKIIGRFNEYGFIPFNYKGKRT